MTTKELEMARFVFVTYFHPDMWLCTTDSQKADWVAVAKERGLV